MKIWPSSCSPDNGTVSRCTAIAGQLHGFGRTRAVAHGPAVMLALGIRGGVPGIAAMAVKI